MSGNGSDVDIVLSPLDEDSSVESEQNILSSSESKIDTDSKNDVSPEMNIDGMLLSFCTFNVSSCNMYGIYYGSLFHHFNYIFIINYNIQHANTW